MGNPSQNQENIQENSQYIRVTEVLAPFSGLHSVPKDILANAARRGSKVHDVCESIIKGLGEWGVDDEIKGYVESFKKWWSTDIKVLTVEQRFFCSKLMITGQVDMIIQEEHGAIILDLKTSAKPSKTWPLQGAAYAYLARAQGYDIKGIHFLHLNRKGDEPHLYVYDDEFEMFNKCLEIYKFFFTRQDANRKAA